MKLKEQIQKRLNELGARTQAYLYLQVPVDTGKLKRSLKVQYFLKPNSMGYSFKYLDYGVYTNLGTGRHYNIKWGTKESIPYNLPPFIGYRSGKGTGGIRPQYWLSLSGAVGLEDFRKTLLSDIKEYTKKKLLK